MDVLHVTSREFRDKQKSFFELADEGKKIVIRRKNKSYILALIEDDDYILSDEVNKRIELSRKQYREGNFIACKNAEEAKKFLESL